MLGAAIFLVSCGKNPFYEEYAHVSDQGWYKDSIVRFTIDIQDTSTPYELEVHLRNNGNYPYSNIYLFRKIISDRGIEFSDTASFTLADSYGKWLGKGVGELKTNTWPYKSGALEFKHRGKYTFTFQQGMRTDYLKGVEDIGLGVYKIEQQAK